MELNNLFMEAVEVDYVKPNGKCDIKLYSKISDEEYYITPEYLKSHPSEIEPGNIIDVNGWKFILEAKNRAGEFIFWSKSIVDMCNANEINYALDLLEEQMPYELLEAISPCEHSEIPALNEERGITSGRKLWIPSAFNVWDFCGWSGKDDVEFPNRGSRTKRFNGSKADYWTDGYHISDRRGRSLFYIDCDGCILDGKLESVRGICPAFSI